jgi:hypothetical protein
LPEVTVADDVIARHLEPFGVGLSSVMFDGRGTEAICDSLRDGQWRYAITLPANMHLATRLVEATGGS